MVRFGLAGRVSHLFFGFAQHRSHVLVFVLTILSALFIVLAQPKLAIAMIYILTILHNNISISNFISHSLNPLDKQISSFLFLS